MRTAPSPVNVALVKSFLEDLKALGDVRIITNNGCAARQRGSFARARHSLPLRLACAQVLESVTTFEGLFYATVPNKCGACLLMRSASLPKGQRRGEYANLIKAKENVDFHLLVDKVSKACFESAPGRGDYTSHFIRLHSLNGDVAVSLYVMWPESAPRGQYAPGQVEAFQALVKKHGQTLSFV